MQGSHLRQIYFDHGCKTYGICHLPEMLVTFCQVISNKRILSELRRKPVFLYGRQIKIVCLAPTDF